MKTFLCSLLAQILLLGTIIGNCFWVNHLTAHVERALSDLPACEQASESVEKLCAYWEARETALGFSIPANELERVRNQLTTLSVCAKTANEQDFALARALCREEITRIRQLERFSLVYIL